jgi:hypothetical protein
MITNMKKRRTAHLNRRSGGKNNTRKKTKSAKTKSAKTKSSKTKSSKTKSSKTKSSKTKSRGYIDKMTNPSSGTFDKKSSFSDYTEKGRGYTAMTGTPLEPFDKNDSFPDHPTDVNNNLYAHRNLHGEK